MVNPRILAMRNVPRDVTAGARFLPVLTRM
jgi:hypothetical protein